MQQVESGSLEPDATDLGDKMAIYGYARVSTDDQDLTVQREALKAAGCEVICEEKRSGTKIEGRAELQRLRDFMRKGDTLVITRIDRLARSNKDFQNIYAELTQRGIKLHCTEQPILNSDGALGGLMINVLAAFAQFETELRKERQAEGIAKAKKKGVYKGSKPRIDRAEVARLKAEGLNPTQIAAELKINRVTVYRLMAELEGKAA
jgi:DNA invertase Pin-like site-specific DNA recombinase